MTRSKKLLNIFLAVAFALLTFGMALAVVLPSLIQSKGTGGLQTVDAASADDVLSTLSTKDYDGQTFYVISTAEQLAALSFKISIDGDATWADRNFELANDINLQENSVIWTPIGTNANPFKGKFNGNGHMITGLVSGFGGAVDENLGFFGKVAGDSASDPAMIYDLVLDDFSFADYVQNPNTSGRLIGYAQNAVLIDVYDLSYALSGTIDYNRTLKTIGTIGQNVKYYIGDTFTANGTNYIPGVNYDPMHGGDVAMAQFDWTNPENSPIEAGYSLSVNSVSNATVYKKGDSSKVSITPFKIALNSDGTTLTVYSDNYYKELPQENEINAANGQPVIEPSVGKKLLGWTLGGKETKYNNVSEINISTLASSYLYMDASLTDLTYNLTIVRQIDGGETTEVTQISVPANSTWESIISQIESAREGYYLIDLYKDTKHYYTNEISYNENWDVISNPQYPSGRRINDWNTDSVILYSDWIGKVSNATILFTNENDTGASLDAMTNLSIVYTDGEPVNSPDLELQRSNDVSGQYTFRAVADQKLTFNFTLPAGYKAMSASSNQGGASLTGGTDGVYTVAINGLLTSGGVVTIPIEREEISLNVTAQNFTISLSGQTGFTTISDNVIKTRVGEKFNIVATPANGYEYASFDVTPGFTTISTPTIASNDVATFPVVVNTFGDSQTLTITSRAKAFTIILDYEVTGYEDLSGVELPELTIFDGTRTVTTKQDAQWDNFTPSNLVTITTTGNAYFNSGVVTLETTSDGSLSGSDGNYQIIPPSGESLIPGGSVFRIKVTYSAKQYTATYDGKFATVSGSGEGSTASNFTAIKDLNGSGISDSNSVIQITADTTYKFGDTITLSYNIVSSYYEFVGWYYSNGEYISNQNNATITAGTNNMTIYAVVKGKTATFNVATGSLIKNYDGTTSSYDKGVALSTPNVNSVSFTYGTPSSGSVSFTLTKGYNGGEYILYNASSSGNPFEQYESGTAFLVTTLGNSISGYNSLTFAQNQNAESVFFDHAGWTLYPIVMQRTISVQAAAGDGSVVSGSESATSVRRYYYGGDGFDISYAINAFKKTGYTASGWSFVLGGQTHNVTDSNILSQGKYLIDFASFNGIDTYLSSSGTITVNRTYSANTYKLYFNQNSGEVLNTTELKHDSTGYYKEVVYDQQIGKLPSITKQGYVFAGWGVNATDLYQTDGNKTVNASWTNQSYVVQINFNGGKVSGQNTMNVNVTYDGSIGTFNKYTANGLASLASQVQRDGFVFDAWHYMVPTTTGDGTTYQYVKEVSDTDILNSSTFAYANFDNTTDPVVYIYAGWQFDKSDYSASVSVNNKTYDKNFVTFNVSVSANGKSYPLSSSQTNLPTNAGVKISSFNWEFNGSPFTGTAYSYGPQIKNVSESGNYEVTFVLSDNSSINVEGIAPQPLTITASTDVTINKATVTLSGGPANENEAFKILKNWVIATQPIVEEFENGDGFLDAMLSANSMGDMASWIEKLSENENAPFYIYVRTLFPYFVVNENARQEIVNNDTNENVKNFLSVLNFEYYEANFKTYDAFNAWMTEGENSNYVTAFEYFVSRCTISKFYDGNADIKYQLNFASSFGDLTVGSEMRYIAREQSDATYLAEPNAGAKDILIQLTSSSEIDVNNFTNLVSLDGKYYVLGGTAFSNSLGLPYIFSAPTTLNMTETTGIEKSSPYTFELSAEYTYTDEFTKIVADVSTTSGDAGVYSFINGNLVINSFRAYVDEENYFTVENQDGTFVVTGAPSGMETTDLNLDNLLLYVAGDFEIVATATTTAVEFDSVVISANEQGDGIDVANIIDGQNYNISISSVRVEIDGSAENISVSLDQETYYSSNGTFVFQIVDNGTKTPILYASSYVKTVTASAQSLNPQDNRYLLSIVEWQEGESYYSDLLTGASTFASNLSATLNVNSENLGGTVSFVAVYSDATYVTISSVTDQNSNANLISGNAFVNFSNADYKVVNSASNAYDLTEWTSAQGATVDESGVVTFAATPTTSLVAHYSLAQPVGSVSDVNQDASADGLSVSSLISNVSITNTDPAISYTYKWFKYVDGEYQEISSVVSTTAGNGQYAVEVTANQTGYNPVTSQKLTFNITFNKIDLTITNSSPETMTYNNEDFASTYEINYTIGEQSYSMTVREALNNNAVADGDKLIITSLKKDGSNVTSIKDAGKYTLSFSLFDYSGNDYNPLNIYNLAGTTTITITVKQKEITLSEADASFTKIYGSSDPALQKSVNGVNGETFIVKYERDTGESVGSYKIKNPQPLNPNYTVKLEIEDNDWFTITALQGLTLSVAIDRDQITRDYDGEQDISVVAEFDAESNAWVLKVLLAGQDEPLGVYTLSDFNEVNGDVKTPVQNVDASTLNGFTFKFDRSVKDVGTYTIVMYTNSNVNYPGGFIFSNSADVLKISAKELSVSDIIKEFDQKATFNTSNSEYSNAATITGLVGEETVVLTGQFASTGIGNDIAINNLEISGEYASNYRLAQTSSTGDIVKNTTDEIIINLAKTDYVYGEINNTLSAFAPTATLNGKSVATYVNITPTIASASYSIGGFLKQGTYSVEFIVTSDYYTVENYPVEITVSKLDISVSVDGEITKVYDRNTNVVQSLSLETVLEGDEVTVSGTYDNEQPGEDKVVTFSLAGADADNYKLTNPSSTGTIERAVIKITAELDTEPDGFVDGASAVGQTSFEINYPLAGSGEDALAILTAPNKAGYNFVGWTFGEDKTPLTAENIGTALDGALDSKALTIYADWEIKTFTVTVNVNEEQGSYTISPKKVGVENVYTYNYWDTVTITAVPNTGYIARNATQTITNISSNQEVNVEFTPATITFTVSVDRKSLYPTGSAVVEFPSEDWVAQGSASATRSILFNALDGILAKEFLPQINVYGYTLASWNSADTVINVDDETTLLEIILKLNNSFNENISLEFNANFTANTHNITFNTDGGTPQPENMSVTYGQAVGVLPTVTKTGYGFIAWVDDEGQTYTQETIFAVDGDVNLTATWGVGIYDFTVNVEHAKVEIRDAENSLMTADGGVYRLSYTQTYTITIIPDAGYEVSGAWTESEPDTFDLEYLAEFTQASLKNLNGNGSITIPTQAIENTITINADKAVVSVTVDGLPVEVNGENGVFTFKAHTDANVEITITPNAGYSVEFDEVSVGTGIVSETSENVYSLSGFTSDVTIDFIATAGKYNATFTYEGGASGVSIISGGSAVAGNNIQVSTGTNLVVSPRFEYGYEFASVSANGATYSIDEETGYITFSEFTQSFTVTITGKAKSFSLSATVFALDSEKKVQDATGFNATVPDTGLFGSEVTFTASKPQEATGYRFIGWFEGTLQAEEGVLNYNLDDVISTDEAYVWTVSGDRDLTAVYEYGVFTIRAYVEGKGQITYQDKVVADSENGSYFSQQFNYSQQLVLTAKPASGYEFQAWMNGEEQYSTSQELTITVQNDLSLTAKFVPGKLSFNLNAGVLINGVLNTGDSITTLAYGKVEWGTYDAENGFVKDPDGDNTSVATQTDGSVYVQITVKQGYTFDNIYPIQGGREAVINLISTTENPSGETVIIYELTGMSSEFNGQYSFIATFVAESTSFNIIFQEQTVDGGYRQVDAGRISVENSAGVRPSGNMTSNVVVDAVTGMTFEVVANLRIGMSFVDSNIVSSTAGTISGTKVESVDDTSTGFTSRLTFSVSEFAGQEATIVIYVTSATYTVKFVDFENEVEVPLGSLTGVKIGDVLTLPEGMALPTKQGYTFIGFYTDVIGAGTRYIDANGNGLAWNDNGYYWNGKQYVKQPNYVEGQDGADGEFTLYAVYVINKTAIKISAVPSAIQDVPPTVGAKVIITNLSDANSWTTDADPFYVEVLYGANINITAPIYDDYLFAYWQIDRVDENGEKTTEIITDMTIAGLVHYGYPQISLTANYNARVAVSGNAGGTVYYTYEVEGDEGVTEIRVDDEAYIPTNGAITLHAEPENGYKFIGWFNGEELLSTETVLRIEAPILAASYNAVFEGEAVTIHIGEYDATHGQIESIMSNGSVIDFSSGSFQAKVGDEIAIYIKVDNYFEVIWTGGNVLNTGRYYYYKVDFADCVNSEMTLTPKISQMKGTVNIQIKIENSKNDSEIGLAGKVSYIDSQGNRVEINSQVQFEGLIGDALQIDITPFVNYKIYKVTFNGQDVTDQVVSNSIVLTLNTNITQQTNFDIVITFARDMWIDVVDDDYKLTGEGNSNNPYIISSAEDLAYVAYMVNERGNTSFANAHYRLGANIDLAGKYWSPIGTEDNRFNGTFDYDVYKISNVSVVFGYVGDLNRDGVFGYLGDKANITEASNDLMIALIIVGVVIFLILLALLIFLLVRRNRKKKLEELANG